MPTNYCIYCGRYMGMRDFEHACDNVNKLRKFKAWCSRCGTPLNIQANDNMEKALCHVCISKLV